MTDPTTATAARRSRRLAALAFFLGLVLIYNANGREMGTYDSQPTKFAARELALHGRLTLDAVIARTPGYLGRPGFQLDRQGHYRSAYSVVPAILAAVPASLLHVTRLVDLRAPLAPNLVAKLTASLLTATAVMLTFLALAAVYGRSAALWVALALGLGTNLWPLASGTLWQLETVSVGLAITLYGWLRPTISMTVRPIVVGAAGLALAASARPQIAPLVGVLLVGLVARVGWRRASAGLAVVGAAAAVLVAFNWYWFGQVLGGAHALQHAALPSHDVTGDVGTSPWSAAAGLLVSPNRGLIVFSPVALLVLPGVARLWRASMHGERWWLAAAVVQFVGYSFYSVWWGGHTYGPRYLMDVMIPMAPFGAAGMAWVTARRWRTVLASATLAYSILVAGTGAFVYPTDQWNQDPEVDLNHQRLWDWKDTQIVRCWRTGPSPQNFSLLDREAVRNPERKGQ